MKWISFEDRQPREDIAVLLWNKVAGKATVGTYREKGYGGYSSDNIVAEDCNENTGTYKYTHWSELPQGPEESRR